MENYQKEIRKEFESGPGNYTVAIVEDDEGNVYEVFPSDIKFETPQEYTVEYVETVDLDGKHRTVIRNWNL
jgi:hypothetical protein